jgi:hypothetical protein
MRRTLITFAASCLLAIPGGKQITRRAVAGINLQQLDGASYVRTSR